MASTERRGLSSVHEFVSDGAAWLVAETPSEVMDLVRAAREQGMGSSFVELTLANPGSEWNGRKLYLDAYSVRAVSPPGGGDG